MLVILRVSGDKSTHAKESKFAQDLARNFKVNK